MPIQKNPDAQKRRLIVTTHHPEKGAVAIRRAAFAQQLRFFGWWKPLVIRSLDELSDKASASKRADRMVRRLFPGTIFLLRRSAMFGHVDVENNNTYVSVTVFHLEMRQREAFSRLPLDLYLSLPKHPMYEKLAETMGAQCESNLIRAFG